MLLLALDVSLRVTAAAAAVALVLLALRVRSGSVRHAAWSAVLVVMLTMPLLMAVVPEIEVPVPSTPALDFGTIASPAAEHQPAAAAEIAAVTLPPGSIAAEPTIVAPEPSSVNWARLAIAAYAMIASLLLLRIAGGWWLARRMVRAASPASIQNSHPVLESALVAAPVTIGLMRPVILLPAGWREWPAFKLTAVLAHESAHIARRDPFVAIVAQVNRAIFWFHPLAWWLERTIAVSAEHACDERAVRVAGDARSYARVLLDFTEAVHSRGGRVAWQGLGVDGTGLLGARIDRLLRGDAVARMSVLRRVTTAAACATVLIGAIACRQQVAATPLREDPEVAKRLADQKAQTERFQAALKLTLAEVDALEARLEKAPGDWDAREQLVTYYSMGTDVPWERKVPGLRRHAIWITANHPDGPVAPPALSPQYDPAGFAEAKQLWEKHLENSNASAFLVYRAAQFFWPYDKPTTERLLLRGQSIDPGAEALKARMPPDAGGYQWDYQLAGLYGSALLGNTTPWTRTYDAARAASPFAQEVRVKLQASRDPRLLVRVAEYIVNARRDPRTAQGVPEMVDLGRRYLSRALELDPQSRQGQSLRARLDSQDRHDRIWDSIRTGTQVGEEDRLAFLAEKAQYDYNQFAFYSSPAPSTGRETPEERQRRAEEKRQSATQAANEALELAARTPTSPDAGVAVIAAHQTLGLLALHDGDREVAVRHLLSSAKVSPVSEEARVPMLWLRLTNYLLQDGERERVIQFFEDYAKVSPRERNRLLADAQAVREGRMPQSYQTMFARP